MFTSPRRKLNEDVVAFPATKAAGAATISSSEIYDFETTAWGPAHIHLMAENDSDIVDTLSVDCFVSFDQGTSWVQVASYADLANGSGDPISVIQTLDFVPRLRVDAVFDGTGELTAGHGTTIDVDMREYEPAWARTFYGAVDTLPATLTAGAAGVAEGTATELPANTDKLVAIVTAEDASKITDNFTWMLQCSNDGVFWWDMFSSAKTGFDNGTGFIFEGDSMSATAVVGKYARVSFTYDATGALAADHGGAAHIIAFSS